MAQHNETGKKGEAIASDYLRKKGYEILEQNWQYDHRIELDIVARDKGELVFVEVKTRSSVNFGYPEEFVDEVKEQHLLEAAEEYIEETGFEGEIRFDIIAIVMKSGGHCDIQHFKDAISPYDQS